MNGRSFLTVARDNLSGHSEAHWRSAAGRAYYALMLEVRDSLVAWGLSRPIRGGIHQYVRVRVFTSTDADMKSLGQALDDLRSLRQRADYELIPHRDFSSPLRASDAIRIAADALRLLDAIVGDGSRSTSITAEIRAVFP